MKKIYYILIALIIFSCKNETSKSLDTNDLIVEDDIDMLYEVSSNKNISYDTFTTERLQDYYDLLVLKQKHPEFIKSIKEQFIDGDIQISNKIKFTKN